MKRICILILSFAISSTIQAGGPWPQPKGKAYIKLYEWWINFDQHYTTNGEIRNNDKTSLYRTGIYAEYGLSDRLTTILNFPFYNTAKGVFKSEENSDNYTIKSVGDAELGLKYGFTNKGAKIPISGSYALGLPFGNPGFTGVGVLNQILKIETGTSYNISKKISGFVSISESFYNYICDNSDEFKFNFELGFGLFQNKLLIIGRYSNLSSLHNGNKEFANFHPNVSIFENDTEYSSYSIEFAYCFLKRLGISFNYASAFKGEWIAAAPAYSVGLFYDFNR